MKWKTDIQVIEGSHLHQALEFLYDSQWNCYDGECDFGMFYGPRMKCGECQKETEHAEWCRKAKLLSLYFENIKMRGQ